jgi:predicted thioredoxin/glutaredoxin
MNSKSDFAHLTEEQIEEIAERAAERAMKKLTDHMYKEVGRGVVNKLFWIIGVISVGLYLWLKQKGVL